MTTQAQSNQVAPVSAARRGPRVDGMVVMLLAPWIDIGGADRVVLDTVSMLGAAGVEVHVVTTQGSENRWLGHLDTGVGSVWNLPSLVPGGAALAALHSLVLERRPDVVHIANSRLGYDLLPLLGHGSGKPSVVSHLMGEEGAGNGYPRYAATVYGDLIDLFITVSADLARIVTTYGIPDDHVATVRPTVDLEHFRPASQDQDLGNGLRVLLPARLSDEKDPLLALDVLTECLRSGQDVRLTLAGDGPMLPQVREQISIGKLQDRVTLAGRVDDMQAEYARHDVVLLTSRYEALPVAACEAMASGLPVIAPAVGGVPEVVDASVGLAVGDRSPVAFASAISGMHDRVIRRELGATARRRAVQLFSRDTVSESLLTAYAAVAGAG